MGMQAIWNGQVVAESDETIKLEGRHYFPRDSLKPEFFAPSSAVSVCPWKGQASYLTIKVGDEVNEGAAWTYQKPKPAASEIAGYVAFWKGVKVRSADGASGGSGSRLRSLFRS
jgi:uncharacterized protein (DUF427 family)